MVDVVIVLQTLLSFPLSVGDKPVFHCELCPTTCGRKTDLRIHVQKLHTPLDKPLKCRRCSKLYHDRYTYKMHTKTHEGEKCYKCDLCPYASISARHLESHLLVHTDQKPFQCDMCEQSFRQKQLLRRHVNLYHNPDYVAPTPKVKTHKCPSCPRSFRHKGNLIRHMALHDPESTAREEAIALKEGRQKRIDIRLTGEGGTTSEEETEEEEEEEEEEEQQQDEAEEDNEQEIMTVEGEDGQYVVLEVIQLQDDEDKKPAKKKRGPRRMQQVNVQVQESEEEDALAECADFILDEGS